MKTKSAIVIVIWSIFLLGFLQWNIATEKRKTIELAQKEAITTFNKDQSFRLWATSHGGVYVPATEATPPNPNLKHIPERDLITPSGKIVTLMNPAYMIREVMGAYDILYETKGHITSLNPLNPNNEPDSWERYALKQFEKGAKEISEIVSQNGEPVLRLIRPMITEIGCLKCHEQQGYKEGDIRGGVGVSVLMKPYLVLEKSTIKNSLISYSLLWVIGCFIIIFSNYKIRRQEVEKIKAVEALKMSEENYREVVEGTDDLITKVDSKGKFTYVNHVGEKFFGLKEAETIGMSAFDFLYPEDQKATDKWFQEGISKHLLRGSIENRLVNKKSGEVFHMLWTSNFHYDEDNRLLSISGIAHDISERKKNEQEREKFITELEEAIAEIKTLRGIIPICSYCKKIRDDKGAWDIMEAYISKNSDAQFSHGVCPQCYKKQMEDMDLE
jgi:PAS domain S-box-containing protein